MRKIPATGAGRGADQVIREARSAVPYHQALSSTRPVASSLCALSPELGEALYTLDYEDSAEPERSLVLEALTMSDSEPRQPPHRWPTTRVDAISDGVFAIAITLLVIEIKISPAEFKDLAHALVHEWPGYLAYVTSFLTIGGVWIAHHNLFSRIEFVDAKMVVVNLFLLMAVAFLPFPTGVLAEALNSGAEAQHTAIIFYGLTVIGVELLLGAVELYGNSLARSAPDRDQETNWQRLQRRRRVTFSTIGYAVAMVVGLLVPDLAAIAYLVIAIALLAATVWETQVGRRWLHVE